MRASTLFLLIAGLSFALFACDDGEKDADKDLAQDLVEVEETKEDTAEVSEDTEAPDADAEETDLCVSGTCLCISEPCDVVEDLADDAPDESAEDLDEDTEEPLDLPDCDTGKPVGRIKGQVVFEGGAPAEGARPQACIVEESGQKRCLQPETTDAEGHFVQSFGGRCLVSLAMRVILPLTPNTTMYCHATLPETGGVIEFMDPFVLFQTTPAQNLPPEGDGATARTVVFANGLSMEVVPDDLVLSSIDYSALSLAEISPDAEGLCFLESPEEVTSLYGFYPEGNIWSEGFDLTLPNQGGFAPGEKAQLYVLGGLGCKIGDTVEVPEGDWFPFATGTVSENGSELVADEPLPCLTWLGVGPLQ